MTWTIIAVWTLVVLTLLIGYVIGRLSLTPAKKTKSKQTHQAVQQGAEEQT